MNKFKLFLTIKEDLSNRGVYTTEKDDALLKAIAGKMLELKKKGSLSMSVLDKFFSKQCRGLFYRNRLDKTKFYKNLIGFIKKTKEEIYPESFGLLGEFPYDEEGLIFKFFRSLSGDILWKDKHFSEDGLKIIRKCFNNKKIKKIRVLSGWERIDENFRDRYKSLKKQLQKKGIEFEVRVLTPEAMPRKHDRYLFSAGSAYNILPSSQLFNPPEGDFSEVEEQSHRKITEKEWRSQSINLLKGWSKIVKHRKLKNK